MKKLIGVISIFIGIGLLSFMTRPDLQKTESEITPHPPPTRSARSPYPDFQFFSEEPSLPSPDSVDPRLKEDPTVEKAERADPDEEDQAEKDSRHGYPRNLFDETKRQMTQEFGEVPSDQEVIAHLDAINDQIHQANEELSENISLMKNYYEEGNLEAIKELQAMIFAKHVKRFPPMDVYPDDDYPRSFRPEEKVQFTNEQFERYLEALVSTQ